MESMVTALTAGIATIADSMLSAVGAIVPKALPIAGGIAVVTIGLRVFKGMAR